MSLRSVYPLKGLHTSFCTGPPIGAETTLRVIVDSDRRVLVLVTVISMVVLMVGEISSAMVIEQQLTVMMADTNQL